MIDLGKILTEIVIHLIVLVALELVDDAIATRQPIAVLLVRLIDVAGGQVILKLQGQFELVRWGDLADILVQTNTQNMILSQHDHSLFRFGRTNS